MLKLFMYWTLAIVVMGGATCYLAYHPEGYTPVVQMLISIFLLIVSIKIGAIGSTGEATKRANEKWMPQAESVIYRLMTLQTNVKKFSHHEQESCKILVLEIPELESDELKAVKIKMRTECDASKQRLDDIAMQLDDAIEDWYRFVASNCSGMECERIYEAIQKRKEELTKSILSDRTVVESDDCSYTK
jgi:hypothetical protein